MLRRGVLSGSKVCLSLFDPTYDKNAGGAHQKRSDVLPRMGATREQEKRWNPTAAKVTLRRVPYTNSSIAELIEDAEEAVAGVHRDHLEPRQRRYVNRMGLLLTFTALALYFYTIWRFGQEVFDDVVIPDFSDAPGDKPATPKPSQ
eukprot:TRINITY_DN11999_c0_g1_i1.p1 TRINITY_DN11999_c0_g1~~TRINITY_DN11999_c0_g1_i1.p1  ORF type:complete len:162 (+),score=28.82 TRINITY_DN11999_c0_g1_i1:50-487(+)